MAGRAAAHDTRIMGDSVCSPATMPLHPRGFDDDVVPHLDAGYRLARWLMRNQDDAEDVVQEASLRALRYYQSFAGGNGRAWFLRIVRNTCWGWRDRRRRAQDDPFDEEHHVDIRPASDPESLLLRTDGAASIARALSALPDRLRTLLVLREFEGLSYQELAAAEGIPWARSCRGCPVPEPRCAAPSSASGRRRPAGIAARPP